MWEFIKAGGWLMVPLILCSIISLAICIERFLRLKKSQVIPKNLANEVLARAQSGTLNLQDQKALFASSLGKVLQKGYV